MNSRLMRMQGSAVKSGLYALALLLSMALNLAWADFGGAVTLPDPIRFGIVVEQGDLRSVQDWLDAGLPPDTMADRVGTGLMIAAWEGNIPMMELFVSHGAKVNLSNRFDEQALQLAAWRGKAETVKWLLDHGATLNRKGRWSALHYAAFANHGQIARLLIERGAEINARAPNGSTVLMMSAREGHEELAQQLLEAGADPKLVNERGDSALTWAMRQGNYRIAQMVSTAAEFSQAALAAPESFGASVRSQPAPHEIEEILLQIRLAQAAGQPVDALRKKLYAATARFKRGSRKLMLGKASTSAQQRPSALMITARRDGGAGQHGGERAELVYSRSISVPGGKPVLAAAPAEAADQIGTILQQIQQAQADGKPVTALRQELFAAVERFKKTHENDVPSVQR